VTDIVETWVVLVVCLAYGAAAWLVQMHRSAPPRDWLLQRIWWLQGQIASGWGLDQSRQHHLKRGLDDVEKSVSKPWLWLSVSKVQAGWRHVHGVEDEHLLQLDAATATEELRTAQAQLQAVPGPQAAGLVKRIEAALGDPAYPSRQALLREAEQFRHDFNDSRYENLANLIGKAVWLTWGALLLVVALAALFDRESLFLLGVAGALISRLTRVLRRRPKASDYGAEWSTLLVAPGAGALSGWVGVALVTALANDPFNVLSDTLAKPWDDPTSTLALALAFAFGFSERLFDRLLSAAEGQVAGALPAEHKDEPARK